MQISQFAALIFLPLAAPIGLWVAWNDMKFMKIPNKAVIALFASFVILGAFALPFDAYLWRFPQALAVLVAGFFLNMGRALGAGDAKFAAAMAPLIDPGDGPALLQITLVVLLAAFATHRLFRAVPAVRRTLPDWESWTNRKFPMGLALGGILIVYLGLGASLGR